MPTARRLRSTLLSVALVAGFVVGPQVARADGVDQAQQELDRVLEELEGLRDQLGQLDEDYGAALDRQAELSVEIAAAQTKVDLMSAELGGVEAMLQDIAVSRLTSGGSGELSPIFSTASKYSAAEQRDALGRLALDTGETNVDDLQAMLDDLEAAREVLAQKQQEAADVVATLEHKQAQFAELEQAYLQKYEQAKNDLGAARLAAEEERRAAAASVQQSSYPGGATGGSTEVSAGTSPGRGGGGTITGDTGTGDTGSGDTGTGDTGGGSSGGGTPTVSVPSVSGKAGIAVSAAMGQLGVPYRFAGETPGVAFDCSGLTKWAWGQAGVYLPHQSAGQYASLPHVPKDQAQPGDLIFYYSPIGHVGIYIGGGQMVHAPQTGDVVSVATVHWNKVVGVGRPG